jgi:hypothetical protein
MKWKCRQSSQGKHPADKVFQYPPPKTATKKHHLQRKALLDFESSPSWVRTLTDHTYVLPAECVADLRAHGTVDFNHGRTIHQVQSLAESRLAKQIMEKNDQFQCKSIFLSF